MCFRLEFICVCIFFKFYTRVKTNNDKNTYLLEGLTTIKIKNPIIYKYKKNKINIKITNFKMF